MAVARISLEDKYVLESGRIYVTGTQALVRLPIMQRQRDAAAGLRTGGFISGYRGSPLGGYDQALWQAAPFLGNNDIHFQPGVNEDLAATSVWGTQQLNLFGGSDYDGVFGIWYGKGPGVDRSGDALKHGNLAGTAPNGGVLVLAGDDHTAKSSTTAHQSEQALIAAMIPVLNPSTVQEYLDFGLIGFAMSRYSGCWVAMKCLTDTIESTASVAVDPMRPEIVIPTDAPMPDDGVHIRWPDSARPQEERLLRYKLPAVRAFAKANRIDRVSHAAPKPRFGIVSTGKAWLDVCQALHELGLDEATCASLGITVYKVGMPWPMEPEGLRAFAEGLEEIIVVEEKRAVMEDQIARILFDMERRPRLVGKTAPDGSPLLSEDGDLSARSVGHALAARLAALDIPTDIRDQLALADRREDGNRMPASTLNRAPWFCAGCPHNSSTKVPEGSRAMAGIGCHTMAVYMPNRRTATYTHMGGEGANWIGQAPFAKEKHVFQNLGDGTYFHSGKMAIRAAAASGVNITYKILFNDAVAMTGGQRHDGQLTPWQISRQVHAEGVKRIVVVTDEPEKYVAGTDWAPGTTIRHRDELEQVQRELREVEGVTILIYDQTCAAEKRRRRKRGTFPDPAKRAFINEAVCEGCGDCGVVSNCVAVLPLETEFGRKRQIDQSNCNKDFSCVKGFCPSFVTVEGGALKKPARPEPAAATAQTEPAAGLPEPTPAPIGQSFNILVTGIGGTGVVTVGALLGMAAHIEGKGVTVLDQTGLAQKNGAVTSHVRIMSEGGAAGSTRIPSRQADLVLGCDMVVAAGAEALATYAPGRTRAVINRHLVPVASFALQPDMKLDAAEVEALIAEAVGGEQADFVNATRLATALLGNSIAANLFLVGFAFQRGLIPLSVAAFEEAIALNGVAVEANRKTFDWGRRAAADLEAVESAARPALKAVEAPAFAETLDDIVARRRDFLTGYQNARLGRRYAALVEKVRAAEAERTPGRNGLAEAVARGYHKLLAYKDEYEVARLYASGEFEKRLGATFEGDYKLKFHLAPPLFAKRDPLTGHLVKQEFGPSMMRAFRLLARLRGLRGTFLDPFGRTDERRAERRAIRDYEALVGELVGGLDAGNHGAAVALASLPLEIRGFGHVKEAAIAKAAEKEAALRAAFRGETGEARAAAE
ncbi:indolepyruvate ferredoxin oxidoreductase family protein [Oceanibacterium hippocampi]|uniref:Indolepyruvate ferredoxin oxidoreductase n=1 Tax=Oceanibacterium hippocampi TaxID=745714 RepID=A0A1Y5TUW0_9PROT|nr:indolepyruvate ferredoxin oxidoreductase family protein [Oceanibacterium hippocampi]SLN73639.1 indolepyruvate ferredoxin oxidoreductase [Oceanibacterium hippocampi]